MKITRAMRFFRFLATARPAEVEPEPLGPAEQAMAEDGFTSLTRYLAVRPFPQQQDRSAA
ncbi:hypothetical protein ACFW9O_17590 [Streptomyces sp. NPDC059499]|uniref:hypothetical protein n=1 Tax=Streptomyces sp. NPDC059499 TaxID=3346852 RepID=UPI0036C7AC48